MDTDTDGAIRIACNKNNPNYKMLARLAMQAVDGLHTHEFGDCFGRYAYADAVAYAEKLLESGELKYELAKNCSSDGITYSSSPPSYEFRYSVRCKGFDPNDAWASGISPAMYTQVSFMLCDDDIPSDGDALFGRDGRRMFIHPINMRPVRSKDDTVVTFDIPIDKFAKFLPADRYVEFMRSVHRYGMQPQVHCLVVLFNTTGIQKLCRMIAQSMLSGDDKGTQDSGDVRVDLDSGDVHVARTSVAQDKPIRGLQVNIEEREKGGGTTTLHGVELKEGPIQATCSGSAEVSSEAQFCVNTAEPANVVPVTHGIDWEDRQRAYEAALAKREEMWADCCRGLGVAGISSKTCPDGLYKVVSGECLDLFIAGSCQGFVSPHVGNTRNFFAERGDRYVVSADRGNAAYVFIKGHHVAVRRFSKDGREFVIPAEPLPTREYTVGYGERTRSGEEGREMQHKRGTVWVDLSRHNDMNMAAEYESTELKPGTYRVYGSDDMYSMIYTSPAGRLVIPLDEAVDGGLVTEREARQARKQCSDTEEPGIVKG